MFATLAPQPADKIIELMAMFAADERPGKIDLGVGVYKDASGRTPVMRAVREAERRLVETQGSKSYVGLLGDLDFVDRLGRLIFGDGRAADRLVGSQTPGGTGAVYKLFELARLAGAGRVWHSDPTWPNHPAILKHLGIPSQTYRYFDPATGALDAGAMMTDLDRAAAGDVVLLHGCCHNPTGANLTDADWQAVTDLVLAKGLLPMVDLAYQGFGDGLDRDVAGLRAMAARVPVLMVAASCSKNFGVYRDRVGAAYVLAESPAAAERVRGTLAALNRLNYSFPPDHGAKAVEIVLADDALRADWAAELDEMRGRMLRLREGLAESLRRETNSGRFDFVASHRGMFSRLGLAPDAVDRLRAEHAVYMVGDSRINVAGLPEDRLDGLARAIAAVAG